MTVRTLIGLAVGSGFDAAEGSAVRVEGVGLGAVPRVSATARVPLTTRDDLAAALAAAVRKLDLRGALAAGLLTPLADDSHVAEQLAERTGLTVVTGFRGRDVAAGGTGHLVTAAADFLLFRDPSEARLLVHLGAVTSVLLLPADGRLTDLAGFEAGPGNHLLDAITSLGTRGRETHDTGGGRAVQGRCVEGVLGPWLAQACFQRPKAVPREAFGEAFLTAAFEAARSAGATLNDLLCTATHFVARCVGSGSRRWLTADPRAVLVSGGGARNGFLMKLIEGQFAAARVERLTGRTSAAAAVLAGLTLDGVAANLPLLTGAAGSRLVGRVVPGDHRNWAACAAWMAEQLAGYAAPRAA